MKIWNPYEVKRPRPWLPDYSNIKLLLEGLYQNVYFWDKLGHKYVFHCCYFSMQTRAIQGHLMADGFKRNHHWKIRNNSDSDFPLSVTQNVWWVFFPTYQLMPNIYLQQIQIYNYLWHIFSSRVCQGKFLPWFYNAYMNKCMYMYQLCCKQIPLGFSAKWTQIAISVFHYGQPRILMWWLLAVHVIQDHFSQCRL